jgi:two-component system response regulator WspF
MRLGLIHPDPALAAALFRSVSPEVRLCWHEVDPQRAESRPAPDCLLLSATASTPVRVRHWLARGSTVILLTPRTGSYTDVVYAALDAGALGQLVIDQAAGWPELLPRLERWVSLRPRQVPRSPPIVALGASAGGPQALTAVLADFPFELDAAVVVVLHFASESARELAHWLQRTCRLPVSVAAAGDAPVAGQVVVADSGGHLELDDSGGWQVTPAIATDPVHPSVDRLFRSLAVHARPGVAALLSGMGTDGAAGLLALRRAGWFTVAQDAGSSRVWGMPRAAAEAGAAVQVLPLQRIAAALLQGLSTPERA